MLAYTLASDRNASTTSCTASNVRCHRLFLISTRGVAFLHFYFFVLSLLLIGLVYIVINSFSDSSRCAIFQSQQWCLCFVCHVLLASPQPCLLSRLFWLEAVWHPAALPRWARPTVRVVVSLRVGVCTVCIMLICGDSRARDCRAKFAIVVCNITMVQVSHLDRGTLGLCVDAHVSCRQPIPAGGNHWRWDCGFGHLIWPGLCHAVRGDQPPPVCGPLDPVN